MTKTPMVTDRINTEQVLEETGATRRQIDYWVKAGHLHPDNAGRGPGIPLQWPEAEVLVALRIVRLLNLGFVLGAAVDLARHPSQLHRAYADIAALIVEGAP